MKTATPIVVDGQTMVPVDSYVQGVVSHSVRSGRVKGRAELGIRIDNKFKFDTHYDNVTDKLSRNISIIQKVKRKQAKNEPIANKPPLSVDPKACQLEEFDAFRWAFSLPTGCHT